MVILRVHANLLESAPFQSITNYSASKSVASRTRQNQRRILRIDFNLLPQPVDVRLQRVRRDFRAVIPDSLEQDRLRDHLPSRLVEELQDSGFHRRKRRSTFGGMIKPVLGRLEQELPDPELGVFGLFVKNQLLVYPLHENAHVERLPEVVARALSQAGAFVFRLYVDGRQHDDGP